MLTAAKTIGVPSPSYRSTRSRNFPRVPAKLAEKPNFAARRDERRKLFRAVLFVLSAVLVACAMVL
jgi:hypothetical protein